MSLLPSADFYVIEKSSISTQNTALFPIMAHMRTVEAMLFALLEPRNTPPESNIPPRWGGKRDLISGTTFTLKGTRILYKRTISIFVVFLWLLKKCCSQ